MPHQRHIADVALELDPETGLLAYSRVVFIGGRQCTGKTEEILSVATHRCVGFDESLASWVREALGVTVPVPGPQVVLYTAQSADAARLRWRQKYVARLKASSFYKPERQFITRVQRNMEVMEWVNGSTWSPEATTASTAGTGDTVDLAFIDEAWVHRDHSTELSLRPTMMTRPWRQLWITSMVPGPSRLARSLPGTGSYLSHQRRLARARVEAGERHGTALFDFTAPEGADPADPATWYGCMAGIGYTVSEDVVAQDYEDAARSLDGLALVDFCAEYLGWEPTVTRPGWGLVSQSTWDAHLDPQSAIVGSAALGVEVSEDRLRGWVGSAGLREDRDWHVELVEPGYLVPEQTQGISWMESRIVDMVDKGGIGPVVIDPRRPANSLVVPLRNRGITVLTPNQVELAGACGRFFDALGVVAENDTGVRLWHLGQKELDRAMSLARKFDMGAGAFTFTARGVESEISPLYTVVLAMHGHEVAAPELAEDTVGDVW